jgi:hypothetical protein
MTDQPILFALTDHALHAPHTLLVARVVGVASQALVNDATDNDNYVLVACTLFYRADVMPPHDVHIP